MSEGIDAVKLIENAMRDGIREAIKTRFTQQYQNPFDPVIKAAVDDHAGPVRSLIAECIAACVGDPAFRKSIADQVRAELAKVLVKRFGGELEKAVNMLKSDPATRARITLAIEGIVAEQTAAPT